MNNQDYLKDIVNSETYQELQKTIKVINEMVAPVQKAIRELTEIIKPLLDNIAKELDNPDSSLSYYEYYTHLVKYFWVYPYRIKTKDLKNIIKSCTTEEEFDKFMLNYFTDDLILKLENEIVSLLPKHHTDIFNQAISSFNRGDYAICGLGLFSIIDDVLSFYIKDKGISKRANVLQPIVDDIMPNPGNDAMTVEYFILLMMNENIKSIYKPIDFNSNIAIESRKGTNRNVFSHGKAYNNTKENSLSLLNALYYLLILKVYFKKYESKLEYKPKKGFYLAQDKNNKE